MVKKRALALALLALCCLAVASRQQVPGDKAQAQLPEGEGRDLVQSVCLQCHGLAIIAKQRKDAAGWTATVNDMIARGAQIFPEEVAVIANYLSKSFAPESALPQENRKDQAGSAEGKALDLNSANQAELIRAAGLKEAEARAIIRYREKIGRFKSLDQLKAIKGFDEKRLQELKGILVVK